MASGGADRDGGDKRLTANSRTSARWRARLVTVGLLAVIVFAVAGTVEAWPVTSFRLFSQVRTANSSSYRLIAVDEQGRERPVVINDAHAFARRTSSQLGKLPTLSVQRRRDKVLAILDASDLANAHIREVILRRRSFVGDLESSRLRQVSTKDVLRVEVNR